MHPKEGGSRLDKFIKFITTPPKDFVADISYEELSPTNKKRIEQYKNIKAKKQFLLMNQHTG